MDSAIMAASERQDFILQDEQARRTYWSRRMAEHDRISELDWAREEGEEMGLRKGREEGALEIARSALAKGLTPELVRDITGLDIDKVRELTYTLQA